jgi:hypothetical protein
VYDAFQSALKCVLQLFILTGPFKMHCASPCGKPSAGVAVNIQTHRGISSPQSPAAKRYGDVEVKRRLSVARRETIHRLVTAQRK